MTARFWLDKLPSTDPAFAPLQRAAEIADPEDWPVLERAHKAACAEAAWGADLDAMDEKATGFLEFAARLAERDDDRSDVASVRSAELEALGYALGLTSVRVAIRDHNQQEAGAAA